MNNRELLFGALVIAAVVGINEPAEGQLANEPIAQASTGKGEAMLGSVNNGATAVAATGFEENKGQVKTTEGQPAPFVRYRLTKGNTSIFLLDNGIAYQFERVHQPEGYAELMAEAHRDPAKQQELDALNAQVRRETYRMDMVLEGVNPHPRTTTEGRSSDYTNYYNHDALDVHHYSRVTYHDVYPGIDWVIYTTEKGMKYDFVVHPGADPDLIGLRFEHQEELYVDASGALVHGNRLGRFTEEAPVSFQEGIEVETRFILEGSRLRFTLSDYDANVPLVIDPSRLWGTYYGSTMADYGSACTTDGTGNVYLAGLTGSASGISAGGHQNTIGGGNDGFLVKFNAAGLRQWGTYYGGGSDDRFYSCAVDADGNIIAAGTTSSTDGIAANGLQNTYSGSGDAFVVKFNANGVRQWATYYGGTGGDYVNACAVDNNGNIALVGSTTSGTGISFSGFQNYLYGGDIFPVADAFIVKFSANGLRQWASYYGGAGSDGASACCFDSNGNVYFSGSTMSEQNIASGGHQNTLNGPENAFLVKFNASGGRLWGTYYGGATPNGPGDARNYGYGCATDGDNIVLAGSTQAATLIASGGHQNTLGGGTDGFLVKFNSAGVRQWGTYYGGGSEDVVYSCAVDLGGNIIASGYTGSVSGIAANGFQNTYNGSADAFVVKFSPSGLRQWGSYCGGSTYDYSRSCAFDVAGDVFITGETASATGIAENGFQNVFAGGLDAFLVKIESGNPPITTGTINGSPLCSGSSIGIPYSVSGSFITGNVFTAQLSNAAGSFASPISIGSVTATGSGAIVGSIPLNTPTGSGYRIRVVGSAPAVIGTNNGVNLTINTATLYYADADGDTYGNPVVTQPSCSGALQGYVSNSNDCNDASPAAYVGAPCNDGNPNTVNDALNTICQCVGSVSVVRVFVRARLEGPAIPGLSSMQDQLRANGFLPLSEPYTGLGYAFVTGGGESTTASVLAVTGNNAIVDWVLLELRNSGSPSTRVATRAALLQRDGDVVDVDGVSSVAFNATPGSYYVALRHRNHLGVMTATALTLSSTPTAIDFTSAATGTYGTNARKDVFGSLLLWSGDVSFNGQLKYTGTGNDRDPILVAVGSSTPNNTINGYRREDTNMDGVVGYTGTANDRDPILVNVGSTTPNAVRVQQIP